MSEHEEWRPVPGFEDLYEVSDLGRVRSRRRKGAKGGLLAATPDAAGYPLVGLYRGGRRVAARRVHDLLAEAFIGPRPDGQEVRHLDGDPAHCVLTNLAYGTRLQNADDLRRHGTHANSRKTHCPANHPYDEANTRWGRTRHGWGRWCRTCERERKAARAA